MTVTIFVKRDGGLMDHALERLPHAQCGGEWGKIDLDLIGEAD